VTDFERLLGALIDGRVDLVLIGGFAGALHGASRVTYDLDVVYSRSPENLLRLERALAPFEPYLRGAPRGLPFRLDAPTLRAGLNFTLITTIGELDLLGEVVGGGGYADLLPHTIEFVAFGRTCRCVDLPMLVHLKRAAGRPKDLEAISELEALLEDEQESGS